MKKEGNSFKLVSLQLEHIKVKLLRAALKVKIENEDLFDSYQVTYNF
jgi:hypothetical protein